MASPRGDDARASMLAMAERTLVCTLEPVVDVHTGALQALEALFIPKPGAPPVGPTEWLDRFATARATAELETWLHQRAIDLFVTSPAPLHANGIRLCLNVDGRALAEDGPALLDHAIARITAAGLSTTALCWEFAGRTSQLNDPAIGQLLDRARQSGIRLAADDLGHGRSDLRLLLDHEVDEIKIAPHFLRGIAKDTRRRLFVAHICRFAHILGMRVTAQGIGSEAAFLICRQLGCDLAQGAWIAPAETDTARLRPSYPHIADAVRHEKRELTPRSDSAVRTMLAQLPALPADAPIDQAFELFRTHPDVDLCVVVDAAGQPRGTVSENALRPFAYNRYGRDLLANAALSSTVASFARPCPIADVARTATTLLDLFMTQSGAPGIIVTEAGRYLGMLTATALLTFANERRTTDALDRNPLTRLPGNTVIAARMTRRAEDATPDGPPRHLCYFDFDNFKPFNDNKGFRQGDRAILLFAEAMRRRFPDQDGTLIAHVGGDDFIAIFERAEPDQLRHDIEAALAEFADTVAGLYTRDELAQGWFEATDRYGTPRRFPLLRCSAAILAFAPGDQVPDPAAIDRCIATLKSAAKASPSGLAWGDASILATLPAPAPGD